MSEKIKQWIRPSGKITDNILIATILSIVLMIVGGFFTNIIFKAANISDLLTRFMGSENLGTFLGDYFSFIGIWIAAWLFCLIPKANRPILRSWRHNRRGNNWKGVLAGILLGFAANGICVAISAATGVIKLSYSGIEPLTIIVFIIAIFIQSGAEEVLDRMYLYQKLRRRYKSPLVAIIGNSAVFMALHIPNPGFTVTAGSQIFLIGVIFSLFVYYYDSLWAAMWFHMTWNFTQNIIFGLPNSGIVSEYSIFKLEAAEASGGLFYDPKFGVEGSIGSSIILLMLLVAIVVINRGKPEKIDRWAAAEKEAAAKKAEKESEQEM